MAPLAEIFTRTSSDDSEGDSPDKCRERRRLRIEKRRLKSGSGALLLVSPDRSENPAVNYDPVVNRKRCFAEAMPVSQPYRVGTVPVMPAVVPSLVQTPGDIPVPVYGSISIRGYSDSTFDAITVKPDFCRPDITGRQPLHFFAVYDGHGGSHVSDLCRDLMHLFIEDELKRVWTMGVSASGDSRSSISVQQTQELDVDEWEDRVRTAIERGYDRMNQLAINTCTCGKIGFKCGCQPMNHAFVGSTAVVAVLTLAHIFVANCGNSRAVLCRAGRAIPLSLDHKPERPDELERIHAAGGPLVCQNGIRVYGILNTTRSLGDSFLKSIVISQPEISITERDSKDECMILASDGLWDVLSDDLACNVASTCLRDGSPATAARRIDDGLPTKDDELEVLFPSRSALAAAILCRLAVARGSDDNISVIVVDLKRQ